MSEDDISSLISGCEDFVVEQVSAIQNEFSRYEAKLKDTEEKCNSNEIAVTQQLKHLDDELKLTQADVETLDKTVSERLQKDLSKYEEQIKTIGEKCNFREVQSSQGLQRFGEEFKEVKSKIDTIDKSVAEHIEKMDKIKEGLKEFRDNVALDIKEHRERLASIEKDLQVEMKQMEARITENICSTLDRKYVSKQCLADGYTYLSSACMSTTKPLVKNHKPLEFDGEEDMMIGDGDRSSNNHQMDDQDITQEEIVAAVDTITVDASTTQSTRPAEAATSHDLVTMQPNEVDHEEMVVESPVYESIDDIPDLNYRLQLKAYNVSSPMATCDKLNNLQTAFIRHYVATHKDVGATSKHVDTLIALGADRKVWKKGWIPAGVKHFPTYLKNRLKNELSKQRRELDEEQSGLKRKHKLSTQKDRLQIKLQKLKDSRNPQQSE